ncbi:hypothetical protein [Prochlorococcus sp. MIT 1303]|uniref:hypothetical protein n=1 Tax=Prochlorococcus sp. MIT 1303 TaxID=1723647 RepID=UPI0007B3883B|nr:hypothetical protein [Prochlorococcus sp. MIT 1303]KZR62269.1 hypothetical protein PMIT1303_02474 [Prochlorococcus sp. MIT 1303]
MIDLCILVTCVEDAHSLEAKGLGHRAPLGNLWKLAAICGLFALATAHQHLQVPIKLRSENTKAGFAFPLISLTKTEIRLHGFAFGVVRAEQPRRGGG